MMRTLCVISTFVAGSVQAGEVPYCDQYFIGEISTESVRAFIDVVNEAECDAGARLRVFIQSPGGDPQAAMGLYDWLQLRSADTVAMGDVASAAVPLFLAGEHRTALPNVRFLIHPGNVSLDGTFSDRDRKELDELDKWDDRVYNRTIAERTGLPLSKVDLMVDPFTVFGVAEAREWGFLTE